MADRPTLYLSNWSSHRTPGSHGHGRDWSIMARPRAWEHGDGTCIPLAPLGPPGILLYLLLTQRRAGSVDPALVDRYRDAMVHRWGPQEYGPDLVPGRLWAAPDEGSLVLVSDGDTLCCACSVAEARAGRCHRAWAAPFLVRAGWRVILDGVEVSDG